MKIIKITLPQEMEHVEIVPLADLHLGDSNCDINLIKEKINYIKEHDNCFTILNGDLINNATKMSISDIYGATLTPREQLTMCYDLFSPIKDKILAICSGNHENRTYRMDGIDLLELFSRELGIPDRYAPVSALIFLKVGCNKARLKDARGHQFQYTIYSTHGVGGSKRVGGKANAVEDMRNVVNADVVLHSHSHMPLIFKESRMHVDLTKQTVVPQDMLFVNTNSFLDYSDGYGEAFQFAPNSKETPHIHLSGVKKFCWATL